MDNGFPEKSSSFLLGQDILYTQFNDIEFYFEDITKENFYFIILKKLFPSKNFTKIFPLGGKNIVIKEAQKYSGNKRKVFIVDLDFDELLNNKVFSDNLFYLERYCIENYLVEKEALIELIKENQPKLTNEYILSYFNVDDLLHECMQIFSLLICYFIIIQKFGLRKSYFKNDPAFLYKIIIESSAQKSQLEAYFNDISSSLMQRHPTASLTDEIKNFSTFLTDIDNFLKLIPGKYLTNYTKYKVERIFSLNFQTIDSFTYRLTKNCSLEDLNAIKEAIIKYIKD